MWGTVCWPAPPEKDNDACQQLARPPGGAAWCREDDCKVPKTAICKKGSCPLPCEHLSSCAFSC